MAFGDIIGQDRALRILFGTLKRKRVPSAILFSGDAGIGKGLAALNYAKSINCLQPVDYDCCDSCPSCKKIDSATHPDVLIITLENVEEMLSLKSKEGKDKNRYEFPIEAVRKIEEIIHLKSYEGRKKVIIIDDADAMNIAAANAFLKTLEEPPPDSLIILVSSNPDRLPDTVRSRCINIKFYPLPLDGCKGVISEYVDAKDMDFVLNLAMGRPGLAVSMELVKERERFAGILNNMIQGESKDAWADKGEIKSWLDMASVLLRDMAVSSEFGVRSSEFLIFSDVVSAKSTLNYILNAYQEMQRLRGLLDFNLNKSITWNYVSTIMRQAMGNGQ